MGRSPTLHRPTKDLDLLGTGAPDTARLEAIFRVLCEVPVDDDGVTFDAKSVRAARIKEDAEYEGVRANVAARIGSARLVLQVDVGFGDAVTPAIVEVDFPTFLGAPAPRLRAYPRESVLAEKLEAMVHLGIANSRMKDFVVLTTLGLGFLGAGTGVILNATNKRDIPNTPSALFLGGSMLFFGSIFTSVGIPLWVSGASPPPGSAARQPFVSKPEVSLGLRSVGLRFQF